MERLDTEEGKDTQLWVSAWRLGTRQLQPERGRTMNPFSTITQEQSHKNRPSSGYDRSKCGVALLVRVFC